MFRGYALLNSQCTRGEKSDAEVFYCEERGGSGSVFLAKEEVLFTPFQACREQEDF